MKRLHKLATILLTITLLLTLATPTQASTKKITNKRYAPFQSLEFSTQKKVSKRIKRYLKCNYKRNYKVKIYDSNKLSLNRLTSRKGKKVVIVERIIGKVTDKLKNGKILNPPSGYGDYISYKSVKSAKKGDTIVTYCVYNPHTNFDDDIILRIDYIL